MLCFLILFTFLSFETALGQVNLFKCPSGSRLSQYCDSLPYKNYKVYNGLRPSFGIHNVFSDIGRRDSLNNKEGFWFSFENKKLTGITSYSDSNSNHQIQFDFINRLNTMMISEKLSSKNDYLFYFLKRRVLIMLAYISPSGNVSVIHLFRISSKRAELLKLSALISFKSLTRVE